MFMVWVLVALLPVNLTYRLIDPDTVIFWACLVVAYFQLGAFYGPTTAGYEADGDVVGFAWTSPAQGTPPFYPDPLTSGVLLRGVPAALARGDVRENVVRFLDVMLNEEEGDKRDRVAMSLACHGAIRAGKQLTAEEMRELVMQLEAADSPHTCPHGRPTIVHMSGDALARGFGRR